ncbi:MAG: hypothetical protein RLZZ271_1159 [Pseudomonadota bacterium]|jgi:1-acyl-sn-glycerol-3-phosphate acyltransferase
MWIGRFLTFLVRLLFGIRALYWRSMPPVGQSIYFANHSSHADTIALWSAIDPSERLNVRPVAALDYWGSGIMRRYVALQGLNAILIDRDGKSESNPLAPVQQALDEGYSIIVFPEGTRNASPVPGPFKSGLYWLARSHPNVPLVPVYLDNLHRCLPKGSWLPVPLACTVRFGESIQLEPDEGKFQFLHRAHQALVDLS